MKKEIIISSLITILSLAIAFAAGYFTNQFLNPPELDLPILSQAQSIINNHEYYDIPADPKLEYGMISGMVGALNDPYASFVEPAQHELSQDSFEGEFGGIGSELTLNEDQQIILFPFKDGPAWEAGIEDGDVLVRVDGVEISPELDIHTVVSMIRGPEGERVVIAVQRPPEMIELEFSIKREVFPIPSITWRLLDQYPEIGLIDINLIATSTSDEISQAIEDLQTQQAKFFILDLRGNGGGVLDGGIEIARLFLHDGDVVLFQQYKGQNEEEFRATKDGPYVELPMAILIDQYSASASEIIAGSVQVHQRAPLIGTPSFGKNTIQLVFTLQDSSSIHVTSAVWWLEGSSPEDPFQLIPDIQAVSEPTTEEEVLQLAVNYFLEQ
ncbi:MAG: PDZ domain-containing protein [Gammaproteobacteria bacterium]|nr:PDZ domain-containing protein [Gammaproteobacteria bacterium]